MTNDLRLIIVSGLSGSGKSVALHALEDLDYYCIDNIPAGLLKAAIDEVRSTRVSLLAVGVDARNRLDDLVALPAVLRDLRDSGIAAEIIFLHASDDALLQRYRESRRRHPLAGHGAELRAAIATERELLSEIQTAADLIVDTTHTSVYELAEVIRDRVDHRRTDSMSVLIESFGFKYGIPADADFVFDMRCLPNPYWSVKLRGQTGQDDEVRDFLDGQPACVEMFDDVLSFLRRWIPRFAAAQRSYLTIAIGCTGGQHRSVYMSEKLAAVLRDEHDTVLTRHSALPDNGLR